jgi:hypothetical protein
MDSAGVDGNIGSVLHGRSKADEVECRRKIFVFHGYHDSAFVFGLTFAFQPRRLMIAASADGCKRLFGGLLTLVSSLPQTRARLDILSRMHSGRSLHRDARPQIQRGPTDAPPRTETDIASGKRARGALLVRLDE